jgi:hypothetical protein
MRRLILCSLVLVASAAIVAQQNPPSLRGVGEINRIDIVTPAAPELAAFGPHDVGVRTIEVTDRNRPDVLNTKEGEPTAR